MVIKNKDKGKIIKKKKKEKEKSNNKKMKPKNTDILPAPPVDSITSLIEVAKKGVHYKNISNVMLYNILYQLIELDTMIGMKEVKKTLFYQIVYYLQRLDSRNPNNEYLHTIITGPPGTGKTTVAKILGELYSNLGILSKKKIFKVAKREDFIAEYLGQTAIKTKKLLDSCIGGVLFIDEVYALGPGTEDRDSFSKEAIDTINVFLSEHKSDFCCIIAGYEKDIKKCFFSVNQGLQRRFPWIHRVDSYTSEDLANIMIKMIHEDKWEINVSKDVLKNIIEKNKNLFKNAGGDIEVFYTKCKMAHAERVFILESKHKFILLEIDIIGGLKLAKENILTDTDDSRVLSMYI